VSRAEALINLDAIRGNVATLKRATPAEVMAVVKADGYGHGLLPVARAALAGGATWLGTAIIDEALLLRAAGIQVPILAWLWSPSESVAVAEAIRADVDLSVSSTWALDTVLAAARDAGQRANVHLKIDTGLSRNGAYIDDWPDLVAAAAKAETGGEIAAVGVWSHFAYADDPGHPTVARQLERFREGVALAGRGGLRPRLRHLANSAATLTNPDTHFDLVRPGIAVYGLSPVPTQGKLRPGSGHVASGRGGAGQAGSARRRRLLRSRLPHGRRDHTRARTARLRRRHPAACGESGPRTGRRHSVSDQRKSLHGPVRDRRRRPGRSGR
jgi:alanine racemase